MEQSCCPAVLWRCVTPCSATVLVVWLGLFTSCAGMALAVPPEFAPQPVDDVPQDPQIRVPAELPPAPTLRTPDADDAVMNKIKEALQGNGAPGSDDPSILGGILEHLRSSKSVLHGSTLDPSLVPHALPPSAPPRPANDVAAKLAEQLLRTARQLEKWNRTVGDADPATIRMVDDLRRQAGVVLGSRPMAHGHPLTRSGDGDPNWNSPSRVPARNQDHRPTDPRRHPVRPTEHQQPGPNVRPALPPPAPIPPRPMGHPPTHDELPLDAPSLSVPDALGPPPDEVPSLKVLPR
ncbi:hypothetical protein [Crateriforma conspicua]|uniref:Uncharacterized protein n=1 Tax=Crateriforma conspicua TaxID=2527996 RepID=A0A5C5Y972_9PLAN|nr:hypothetical protein [Crateriforma conspicua]QDV61517.1 hypothetical protein Mal65_06420 [Crateriforma conspicua]TWT72236.1 hypothetical protein Pan14r_45540 [Crateriforma conspicua]